MQNPLKSGPEIIENGVLGGSESLCEALGAHLGTRMAPKIAKRSPKRRQDGQHGAKMGQDGPQEAA